MTISIKLLDSEKQIEGMILSALSDQFNSAIRNNAYKITEEIKSLIPSWINSQPEINALLSRELVGQFGITISPQSIVNSIIDSVINSISISVKTYNNKLKGGGLEISIQPDNFINLLGLPQGHSIYQATNFAPGGDLHWLEWMLIRGDEIIVVGYEYNPRTGIGRTGLGNMISGKGFRVPPQYSGTEKNNFITRALSGSTQEKEITKVFKKVLDT
jgi:hypothetical protein